MIKIHQTRKPKTTKIQKTIKNQEQLYQELQQKRIDSENLPVIEETQMGISPQKDV